MNEDIKDIIESLLFASEAPLTVRRIAEILEVDDLTPVRNAIRSLSKEYDRRKGGFCLSEIAGGYQLRTRPEHKAWIQRMLQSGPSRLSRAAMETLAIVAYKQPVLRSDVEHIRGVDCGGVLRALLERKVIKILGRKEIPGRPLLYGTTRKFLEMFNLRDLKDLPTLKELSPEKSETSDASPLEDPLFSEAMKEQPDKKPSDKKPDGPEASADILLHNPPPGRPSREAPRPEYLPMIIEKGTAIPAPEPDADQASDPDSEPVQPGASRASEKNT